MKGRPKPRGWPTGESLQKTHITSVSSFDVVKEQRTAARQIPKSPSHIPGSQQPRPFPHPAPQILQDPFRRPGPLEHQRGPRAAIPPIPKPFPSSVTPRPPQSRPHHHHTAGRSPSSPRMRSPSSSSPDTEEEGETETVTIVKMTKDEKEKKGTRRRNRRGGTRKL
jgi:hypothetical protein